MIYYIHYHKENNPVVYRMINDKDLDVVDPFQSDLRLILIGKYDALAPDYVMPDNLDMIPAYHLSPYDYEKRLIVNIDITVVVIYVKANNVVRVGITPPH